MSLGCMLVTLLNLLDGSFSQFTLRSRCVPSLVR